MVPIGDLFLFKDYDYCINLGGFSNVSLKYENQIIAYDVCPVNIVLNKYSREIGFEFDRNGSISRSGKISEKLLSDLNNLSFYSKKYPKGSGKNKYLIELAKTFQRRFRQELVDGKIDQECLLISKSLIKTYN